MTIALDFPNRTGNSCEWLKGTYALTKGGNIQLPLPFKKEELLPNNQSAVYTGTKSTLSNLKRNPYKIKYCIDSMKKSLTLQHVEEIPKEDLSYEEGKAWWLPVFAVDNKSKKKVRLVFDGSAQYQNVSLNQSLMSGPDLNNQLRTVLLRFREKPVAFIADIEGMFGAFKVPPNQTDFLRFFWFHKNNPENELTQFRALYHIFGASSSPAIANFGLKYIAQFACNNFEVSDYINHDFYVDDGLRSTETIQ